MPPHQLIPSHHLDHPTPDHPRIYRDGLPHFGLDLGRGVEAQDEVMAGIVPLLVFAHGLCEEEGTPVCEGADDAAVLEEEATGFVGDSTAPMSAIVDVTVPRILKGKQVRGMWEGGAEHTL